MRLLNVLRATLLGSVCSSAIVSPPSTETGPHGNRLPAPEAITPHPAPARPAVSARAEDGLAGGSHWRLVGLVVPTDQVAVRAAVDGVLTRCPGGVGDVVE